MKGKYQIIKGDVTNPIGEGVKIIPHIISDIGVCGAGVAKAIVKKWPNVLLDIGIVKNSKEWGLGTAIKTDCEKDIVVVSMVAQEGLRTRNNRNPIKYVALVKCMERIQMMINPDIPGLIPNFCSSIHCPKFGSGLAGGNWDFIETLIKEIWIDNGIDVTVYDL